MFMTKYKHFGVPHPICALEIPVILQRIRNTQPNEKPFLFYMLTFCIHFIIVPNIYKLLEADELVNISVALTTLRSYKRCLIYFPMINDG